MIPNSTSCEKRITAPRKKKPTGCSLSSNSLFYWYCDSCCHVNEFSSSTCLSCQNERDLRCKSSALLNIAEEGVQKSQNFEEAHRYITDFHHIHIPHTLLNFLMNRKRNITVDTEVEIPPVHDFSSLFFWNCAFCTMKNSYNFWTCNACGQKVNPYD